MKVQEKESATLLRKQGKSINEIVRTIGVSKASVSLWVRNVILTDEQQIGLSERGRNKASIEKRRMRRIENTKRKDSEIIDSAKREINTVSERDLFMFGIALYLGEGGKTCRGSARITSSDPAIIRIAIKFFTTICGVPIYKFRGGIHAHEGADVDAIEAYWSSVTGISRQNFCKTYVKQSIASKGKRKTIPYGTFELSVHDTVLYLKIMAWIEKAKQLLLA